MAAPAAAASSSSAARVGCRSASHERDYNTVVNLISANGHCHVCYRKRRACRCEPMPALEKEPLSPASLSERKRASAAPASAAESAASGGKRKGPHDGGGGDGNQSKRPKLASVDGDDDDLDPELCKAWDDAFDKVYAINVTSTTRIPATAPNAIAAEKAEAKELASHRPAPAAPAAAAATAAVARGRPAAATAAAAAPAAAAAAAPQPPAEPAVKLNALQQRAVDNFFAGKNTYLDGEAGTGKSEVYREIARLAKLRDINVQFLSSTVLSADAVGGITPHSFFGVDIHSQPREAYVDAVARERNQFVLANKKDGDDANQDWYKTEGPDRASRVLRQYGILFDEIGRLTPSMFTTIMEVLKTLCRGIRELPVLLFAGDMMQGSAIRTKADDFSPQWKHDLAAEDAQYIKNCDAWTELNVENITLTEIYRQQNKKQQRLLSAVRMSYLTDEMNTQLENMAVAPEDVTKRLLQERQKNPDTFMPPVYMHCRLREVAEWNKRWLDELKTPEYTAVPQVFLMYRHMQINRQTPTWYVTSLYDDRGKHEYSVPYNYKADTNEGEKTIVLQQEELGAMRRALHEAATLCRIPLEPDGWDTRKDAAQRAVIGKFKTGAPIFTTHNQQRPPSAPKVSNGTRGRIIDTPQGFFRSQTPPDFTAERSSTFLFKEFEPIDESDYTSHFPITMMHQNDDGKLDPTKVSKIGCVDRFFKLAIDDPKDWRQRRLQLVVRAHPCQLMWADTPLHSIGKQYPRGVIDLGSAATFPNGGGLGYVMISRYFDLDKVWIVNFSRRAFYSDWDAWWDNKERDEVASKFTDDEIAAHYELTPAAPDLGKQGTMRAMKHFDDQRICELRS